MFLNTNLVSGGRFLGTWNSASYGGSFLLNSPPQALAQAEKRKKQFWQFPRVGNWLAGGSVSWKPAGWLRRGGFQHSAPYCSFRTTQLQRNYRSPKRSAKRVRGIASRITPQSGITISEAPMAMLRRLIASSHRLGALTLDRSKPPSRASSGPTS